MHSHLAGDMRQNHVSIVEFHLEHRIRQRFNYLSLNLDCLFFGHKLLYDKLKISGPLSVTATVCS